MDVERAVRLNQLKTKTIPKRSYVNIHLHCDQCEEWKLSPQERYQKIQNWKYHQPTIMERRNLKIPPGIVKLDLEDLSHILMLCGGNQQIEFSIKVRRRRNEDDEINIR